MVSWANSANAATGRQTAQRGRIHAAAMRMAPSTPSASRSQCKARIRNVGSNLARNGSCAPNWRPMNSSGNEAAPSTVQAMSSVRRIVQEPPAGLRRMCPGDTKGRSGRFRRDPEPHEIGRMLPHRVARAEPLVPVRAVVVQKAAPELGCAVEVECLDGATPQGVLPHGVRGECVRFVVRGVIAPALGIDPCAGGIGFRVGRFEAFPGESKDRRRQGLRQVFRLRAREQQVVVALVDLEPGENLSREYQRNRRQGETRCLSVLADSSP